MSRLFVTICGTSHFFGNRPLSCGTILKLTKEFDNQFDPDAISVSLPSLGTVGYVANSPSTVTEGTMSASEIRDKIEDVEFCEVMFRSQFSVIAKILD